MASSEVVILLSNCNRICVMSDKLGNPLMVVAAVMPLAVVVEVVLLVDLVNGMDDADMFASNHGLVFANLLWLMLGDAA